MPARSLMEIAEGAKTDILTILDDVEAAAERAAEAGGSEAAPGRWKTELSRLRETLAADREFRLFKVGVVGPVKSGKSTFVNAILRGDYLKRGAGIVTSIVTRVQKGDRLSATLRFKTWQEINKDMEQALVLFPQLNWRPENVGFDIRRETDRKVLAEALATLTAEDIVGGDARNMGSVSLSAYLAGYDRIKDILPGDDAPFVYGPELFAEHRDYAGDDSMAIYLKDLQLTVNTVDIEEGVEVADCQGSDSPNPYHLAMVEEYLISAHLIVYVIAGRTGLRQADYRFLGILKKMGLLDRVLFVLNFDFDEVESTGDLDDLHRKVVSELVLFVADPPIFCVSALFHLFRTISLSGDPNRVLTEKNQQRLRAWTSDKAVASRSEAGMRAFWERFRADFSERRPALWVERPLDHLESVTAEMNRWVGVHRGLLTRSADGAGETLTRLRKAHERVAQTRFAVKSALDGAVDRLKMEIGQDVNHLFDPRSGPVSENLQRFVKSYSPAFSGEEQVSETAGFSRHLYLAFHAFKKALDGFMTESVNPDIIRLVRESESKIEGALTVVARPYIAAIDDTAAEYENALAELGIGGPSSTAEPPNLPDPEAVKDAAGLSLPPFVASLRYTAGIRVEAVMQRGIRSVVNSVKRIFFRSILSRNQAELELLKDGINRLKKETAKSLTSILLNHRENLKFQYLFKLTDEVADRYYQVLAYRLHAHAADLSTVFEQVSGAREDRTAILERLSALHTDLTDIQTRTARIRGRLTGAAGKT